MPLAPPTSRSRPAGSQDPPGRRGRAASPLRPARRVVATGAAAADRDLGPTGVLVGAGALLLGLSRALPRPAAAVLAVLGYCVLGGAAVPWRRRAGVALAALGLAANAAVVLLNGAMPVAGWVVPPGHSAPSSLHRPLQPSDRLTGLADVVRVPGTATMLSPGDVLIVTGGAVIVTGGAVTTVATFQRRRRRHSRAA